ncbi:MAG TPA: hypothetical protein PLY93_14835 [Turneriella sp.]|nr:hypothetical protein [Turneriella sp.]
MDTGDKTHLKAKRRAAGNGTVVAVLAGEGSALAAGLALAAQRPWIAKSVANSRIVIFFMLPL